jgi:hypothetical protein
MPAVRAFLIVLGLAAILPAATANAHSITPAITLPASPPVEDSGFAIGFTGNTTSLPDGYGYLYARIRPAGGTPCAPTYDTDPGTRLLSIEQVTGNFSNVATYTPPAAADYLVCAWIEDRFTSDSGPPASAVVTVRPAILQIATVAPSRVNVGVPFAVTVNYRSEVPRFLTVLVARATSCSVSSEAFRGTTTGAVEVADDLAASGSGTTSGTVRLDTPGLYLVCGYLEEEQFGSAAAQYVAPAVAIVVSRPAPVRKCRAVGGRRHIRAVRARAVSCAGARTLARQWGLRRRAPSQLGVYRCSAAHRVVTCTASASRQVKFTFGRA